MNILVTGAHGFIGSNLIANLRAQNSNDATIFSYDQDSTEEELREYCQSADFVFHLAGINRPKDAKEFYEGNTDLTHQVLGYLEEYENRCPVLLSSSIQAALDNDYGKSKHQAEEALLDYGKRHGSPVHVYRLPGVFGKWCRPNYNSVVATFCYKVAHGEEVQVNGRETALTLVYIDDVVNEFIACLKGSPHQTDEDFCSVPTTHDTTLGELIDCIESFRDSRSTLAIANMSNGLEKKLYSTYLSYLPEGAFSYPVKMNRDERGSFTELFKSPERGQVSVNITKPGIVKGQHWHNTKTEKFVVVSGEAIIRFRKIGQSEVITYKVSGDALEVVDIPVGYTHSIENVGQDDMVALIWCNEVFNPDTPDTNFEKVLP